MQSGEPQLSTGSGGASMRLSGITLQDLARRMRVGNQIHIQPSSDDDYNGADNDEDDDYISTHTSAHWHAPVTEPQKAGLELLVSGDFGRVGVKACNRRNPRNIPKSVLNKYYSPLPLTSREDLQSVRRLESFMSISHQLFLFLAT
jgi:WD repeat-containing protein 23